MEFRDSFAKMISNVSDLDMVWVRYTCYRGKLSKPSWLDNDACTFPFILYFKRDDILTWKNAVSFSTIFTIHADMSTATKDLVQKKNPSGEIYYKLNYDAIVYFGLTEIKAELAWQTEVSVKPYVLRFTESILIPERRTPVSVQSIHLVGLSNSHVSIPAMVVFEE